MHFCELMSRVIGSFQVSMLAHLMRGRILTPYDSAASRIILRPGSHAAGRLTSTGLYNVSVHIFEVLRRYSKC
jgi:hypothetical protein